MTIAARLAQRLRDLRTARGWTQTMLAERAKISRVHLARIEGQAKEPTLGVIDRLARALKVTPGRLLDP
jgi:transcriptional regulator with XRE-family HTH domain